MEMDRSPAEDDEIDVLAILIEDYEDRFFPMDPPDPVEACVLYKSQDRTASKLSQPYTSITTIERLRRVEQRQAFLDGSAEVDFKPDDQAARGSGRSQQLAVLRGDLHIRGGPAIVPRRTGSAEDLAARRPARCRAGFTRCSGKSASGA